MKYNFERWEHFNYTTAALTKVGIDEKELYGFFERIKVGLDYDHPVSEGGLWFEWVGDARTGKPVMALVDYDGVHALPKDVVFMLKQAGVYVSPEFEG